MSKSLIKELQQQQQQYWIDIYESRQTQKILKGKINAVEQHGEELCSCVFYGDAKILIPSKVFNMEPEPKTDEEKAIRKRKMFAAIGADIEFCVIEISREENLAIASRKKAMEIRQKEIEKLKEGQKTKCRVMAVGKYAAIVEAHGVEKRLLPKDISWGLVDDLRDIVAVGDELDCIVKNIDPQTPNISISIKETMPNPYLLVDKKYIQDSEYLGTVSLVRENGVFVNLEPGVDALCPHPGWPGLRLNVGDKVVLKIRKIDGEKKKIRAHIERLVQRAKF